MLFCFCLFQVWLYFVWIIAKWELFIDLCSVFRHQKITHWCINLDLRQLLLCCWKYETFYGQHPTLKSSFENNKTVIGGRYLLLSTRNTGQSLNYSTDQILKIPKHVSRIACMKYFPREKHWPCVMTVFASFLPVLLLSSV